MTMVTLRPNADVAVTTFPSLTGGTTAWEILSDDSDGSHLYVATGDSVYAWVAFDDASLPAGAVVTRLVARFRQRNPTGGVAAWYVKLETLGAALHEQYVPATIAITTMGFKVDGGLSDAQLDGLRMYFEQTNVAGDTLYEAYVDVYYVEQPVVSVVAPTGTLTTSNRPTVSWTNTLDSSGGSQNSYEVRVFSAAQYGAGGFHPATSVAMYSTVATSAATSQQVGEPLSDGAYRAYVRVAQNVNGAGHWSEWDYEAFTIDVDVPALPLLTLTPQSAAARIAIGLEEQSGVVTTDDYEVERASVGYRSNLVPNPRAKLNTAGWDEAPAYFVNASVINRSSYATPTVEIDDGFIADYFTVSCSGASVNEGRVIKLLDAMDLGQRYRAWVYLHRENSAQDVELVLGDAVNGQNAAVTVDMAVPLPWTRYAVSHVATNTGPLYLAIRQPSATNRIFSFTFVFAAEVDNDASLAYGDGDSPGWHWTGTEHASVSEFGEWLPVRNNTSDSAIILASTASIPYVAIRDYEAPNGSPARYRVRALHDYGSSSYGASEWVKGTATWQSTQWWLKHPNRPDMNLPVEIVSYREVGRGARQTAFQPLGGSLPVVISDTRGGATGTVVLRAFIPAEQDALNTLLDTTATLLLQGPPEDGHPDRYVRIGDHGSSRVIDKSFVHITDEALPWTLVARPPGALSGEYTAPIDDEGEELVVG